MNYKASARCANGHVLELGTCRVEPKKLFGGTKVGGSKGFGQDYAAGTNRYSGWMQDRHRPCSGRRMTS